MRNPPTTHASPNHLSDVMAGAGPRGRVSARIPKVVLAAMVVSGCGGSTPGGPDPDPVGEATVVVDPSVRLQTIDGFGSQTLPLVYGGQDYLGSLRPAALDAAYTDIGLSLGYLTTGLVETPADALDPWDERGNDNADPFDTDLTRFNFGGMETMRETVLLPARARGYDDLTLGPLVDMRARLAWLGTVRDGDYQVFLDEVAEHVLAVVSHHAGTWGEIPDRLVLFNEPTTGNTELQTGSVAQVVDVVKRVGQRLEAAGFTGVRFVVPNEETMARNLEVASAILSDPEARRFVGAIGYHPYPYGSPYASVRRILEDSGTGSPDAGAVSAMRQLAALGEQYGVPVWLTEVTEGPALNSYPFGAMENVLARAIHIHDNFVYAGATAFFGMNTLWDSRSHAEHFAGRDVPFLSEASHMVLVDLDLGEVLVTGLGHAVAHYARGVRPGSQRVEAESRDPDVLVTAFRSQDGRRLTAVLINIGTAAESVALDVAGQTISGAVTGVASFGTVRRAEITPITPQGENRVEVPVPARGVVTVSIPIT